MDDLKYNTPKGPLHQMRKYPPLVAEAGSYDRHMEKNRNNALCVLLMNDFKWL